MLFGSYEYKIGGEDQPLGRNFNDEYRLKTRGKVFGN